MGDKREKIEIVSPKETNILKLESMKDYIGKNVVSKSGEHIGSILDVLFTDKIHGMIVSKGFFSRYYVDKSYFSTIKEKAMLSMDPALLLVKKVVFDSDGKRLGKVARIKRKGKTNELEALIVKKRFFSKPIEIPKSSIDVMKKNIILNKKFE